MLVTNLDFKLEDTTQCANDRSVPNETSITPRVGKCSRQKNVSPRCLGHDDP